MFERNAPLLLCFSISFRRTSSKYFRSASSFLLYAAVTNFSFPSYRASSFSRSLIRFLEHELGYRCRLLVHNLHFSLPLLCSLLHHGNVFALIVKRTRRSLQVSSFAASVCRRLPSSFVPPSLPRICQNRTHLLVVLLPRPFPLSIHEPS